MAENGKTEHIPFTEEDAQKFVNEGEQLAAKCSVKTEGFEKSVVLLMTITEDIWKLAQKNKSFRMELFYDAEALNVNYCFFIPLEKGEKENGNKCNATNADN